MTLEASELNRRLADIVRVGTITSVDPETSSAIVNFGEFKSPPLQVGQLSAGAIQFWWMPSVGEQVLVASEGGDIAQGKIICSIYAGNAPSSDGGVPQINLAGGNMQVNGSIVVTGDVIASGVSLVNHTHKGVITGPDKTGAPNK
jgi:phage baseplate assembly protein gpV